MADRPILFSAPMVRALIEGRKTQTRRMFKGIEQMPNGLFHIFGGIIGVSEEDVPKHAPDYVRIQPGDRLWVRENSAVRHTGWHYEDGDTHTVSYRADEDDCGRWLGLPSCGNGPRKGKAPSVFPSRSHNQNGSLRWQPSIHMPRWASRLTLTVTDVRVERLQDLSPYDAEAEGCPPCPACNDVGWINSGPDGGWQCTEVGCGDPYVDQYARLWDRINGQGAWEANPWVVAYTFSVQHGNIDQIAKVAA